MFNVSSETITKCDEGRGSPSTEEEPKEVEQFLNLNLPSIK